MNDMVQTCLITGGSGLIGKHLVNEIKSKYSVTCLIRDPKKGDTGTDIIEQDLAKPLQLSNLPPQCDCIIHLAQSENYRDFPGKSLDIYQINTLSTLELLDYGLKSGIKKFIYASTGGVYGFGDKPFSETAPIHSKVSDLGFYATSKINSEMILQNYTQFFEIIIFRFFFVYGPGQKKNMLMARLIDSVIHKQPIVLQGNDGISINPVHVKDAVMAIVAAMELKGTHVINIAGPEILTMKQIGETIGNHLNMDPIFSYQENIQPKNLIADITKMKVLLKAPQISFYEGIKTMIDV
jgi:nucleoside-diphosphate-sugar epimerase